MGCDIHLHIEIKVSGKWLHYQHPSIARNYLVFSKMAGVRAMEDSPYPIAELRGLPKDITEITKLDVQHWKSDGHSHSWLEGKEVKELMDWIEGNKKWNYKRYIFYDYEWGCLFRNSYSDFFEYKELFPPELEDIRFVFWFDN